MIRDVDLVGYLPEFMKTYKEPVEALKAEDPEFYLIWEATDRVLYNRFIETADEYGISRYESMLGIIPSEEDSLESRRARVRSRWFSSLPYTWRMLLQKLTVLCGDTDFTITNNFDGEGYTITLIVDLELYGEVEELDNMLNSILPANIVVECSNEMPCIIDTTWKYAGAVVCTDMVILTTDFEETFVAEGSRWAGGAVSTAMVQVSNDFNEVYETEADAKAASGTVICDFIEISN